MNQPLRVGVVAKACRVSEATVKKWIRTKLLPGHRLPPGPRGHGHYRVMRDDLREFLSTHGMPLDQLPAAA